MHISQSVDMRITRYPDSFNHIQFHFFNVKLEPFAIRFFKLLITSKMIAGNKKEGTFIE